MLNKQQAVFKMMDTIISLKNNADKTGIV